MKTIRLFISSTFRDMHAERDWLNRVVFPELRSRCRRRGAEFVGVDLRWGVTEEEARQRGALAACLEEIGRCDLFLGLVGERYGWVPPPEVVSEQIIEAARERNPTDAPIIDSWYRRDGTVTPPVWRLRRGEAVPPEVAERLTAFWEGVGLPGAGESVTALELLAGALDPTRPAGRAFVYLRAAEITAHPRFPHSQISLFDETNPTLRCRLETLKAKVRNAAGTGVTVREYPAAFAGFRIDPHFLPAAEAAEALRDGVIEPAEWDAISDSARQAIEAHGTVALTGMGELGSMILNDLWPAIESELRENRLGEAERPSWHERFARERSAHCLGRTGEMTAIFRYLQDPDDRMPLVLTGPPGCGKSTLMAACAERLRGGGATDAVVLSWFIGAAPDSTDLTAMIGSLCEQLRQSCRLDLRPSPDPDRLRLQLPAFLAAAATTRPVTIFIDALNQLDPGRRTHELAWFPFHLPPMIKVVAGTLAGTCLDRLSARVPSDHVIVLPTLEKGIRATLIDEHLARRGKRLSDSQQALLLDPAARPDAVFPLYLVAALEELCCHGDFATLSERIAALPPTVAELFDQILTRLERDHGEAMATAALRAIAVSREGLLEAEIIDMLSAEGVGPSSLHWTRFYRALEPYLRPAEEGGDSGPIGFFHDQLRFAAFRRYLAMNSPVSEPSEPYRLTHERMADYFRAGARMADSWDPARPRLLAELPYHLAGAGRQSELGILLSDFSWLQARLSSAGPAALISDYDHLPGYEELSAVQTAIRLSLHVIIRDPRQLCSQLTGRLLSMEGERIRSLIAGVRQHTLHVWFCPLTASLTHPGEALIRTLVVIESESPKRLPPDTSVAVSADGGLVVARRERTIKGWEVVSGQEIFSLESDRSISGLDLAPDGRFCVVFSGNEIDLWDLAAHKRTLTLRGHSARIFHVELSPDGRLAASVAEDHSAKIWKLATGEVLLTIPDFSGSYGCRGVKFVDAHHVAVAPCKGKTFSKTTIKTFCLDSGQQTLKVTIPSYTLDAVAASPSRRFLLAGHSGVIWGIDRPTDRLRRELRGYGGGYGHAGMMITKDELLVVPLYGDENTLATVDLNTGLQRATYRGHARHITGMDLTLDGRIAVTGSEDNTVRVLNLEAPGETDQSLRHHASVNAIALSPDNSCAVSGAADGSVKVWDLRTCLETRTFAVDAPVTQVVIPAGSRTAIIVGKPPSGGYVVDVWDLETGEKRTSLPINDSNFGSMATTSDGRYATVASHSFDNYCEAHMFTCDLESGNILPSSCWTGHDSIPVMAAAPGTHQFLYSCGKGRLALRDAVSGTQLANFEAHEDHISHLAFARNGHLALSGSWDGSLVLWDMQTFEARLKLTGHTNRITALAMAPDGCHGVSAAEDGTVRVWDLRAGSQCCIMERTANNVAITPDGRRIILVAPTAVELVLVETGEIECSFFCTMSSTATIDPVSLTVAVGEATGDVHLLRLMNTSLEGMR